MRLSILRIDKVEFWLLAGALAVVAVAGAYSYWYASPVSPQVPTAAIITAPEAHAGIIPPDTQTPVEDESEPHSVVVYNIAPLRRHIEKAFAAAHPDAEQSLPDGWSSIFQLLGPDAEWELADDQLTVTATKERHSVVDALVQEWNRRGLLQCVLEIRLIDATFAATDAGVQWNDYSAGYEGLQPFSGPFDAFPPRLLDNRSDHAGPAVAYSEPVSPPVLSATLDDEQARAFIERAQDDERSNLIFAPKVALVNGQSGNIGDATQRPLVVLARAEDGSGYQLETRIFEAGTRIYAQPTINEDGSVQMAGRIELSSFGDIQTGTWKTPEGRVRRFQIPENKKICIDFNANLASEKSLLVTSLGPTNRESNFYLLLKCTTEPFQPGNTSRPEGKQPSDQGPQAPLPPTPEKAPSDLFMRQSSALSNVERWAKYSTR